MEVTRNRVVSIAGTALFHALLIVLLLFYYIKPTFETRVSEPLEGVPVMFGNVPDALGDEEPFGRGNNGQDLSAPQDVIAPNEVAVAPEEKVPTAPKGADTKPVVTQDFEETVAVREAKKAEDEKRKQEAIVAEQKRREEAEAKRQEAMQTQQRESINNQMAGLFGNGSGSGSRGDTEGTGTQGVPTGNASYGKTSGVGGWGSYDLGGRGVGSGGLVKPSYNADDYGTVVIDIIVSPQGRVVEASIGRGTNTPSSTLKNEALRAARATKFQETSKPGNQKGIITYKFNLN